MKTLLGIVIPTFNRANRLEKSLGDLLNQINKSEKKQYVSVFVSDNGSIDETAHVINKYSGIFKQNNILFFNHSFSDNRGFDANVLTCYRDCGSDYVWFLSDDDNVIDGAIDLIIDNIREYSPSVIYYNFDQKPYTKAQPYIKDAAFFEDITSENIIGLQKIIRWPKLTSLVIKKSATGLQVPNDGSGFAHVALALQFGLAEGRVLHSPVFTAYPDDDYLDNIDFPPYIGNNLNIPIRWALQFNEKMYFYNKLAVDVSDPLISSLNTLGAYYRGKFTLTPSLKIELWKTVKDNLNNGRFKKIIDWQFLKEVIKLPMSIAYGFWRAIVTGKKVTKERQVSSDS